MIGAYTPICQEDERWVSQYLAEVERLGIYFAIHLDRCSLPLKLKTAYHPRCIGYTEQNHPDVEYREDCREKLINMLEERGVTLALLWDIDETWERMAPEKLQNLLDNKTFDNARVHWINLWGDNQTVRIDNHSNPYRVKINRLDRGINWTWNGIVVDPYADGRREVTTLGTDLVCLHHGLKTPELRRLHKERWDRVYGYHLGKNPYSYWNDMLDEVKYPPVLGRNVYT